MIIAMVAFYSCKKDETKVVITSTPGAPVLSMTEGQSFVLTEADKDVPLTFFWSAADFGAQVIVTYELKAALAGTGFEDPVSIGIVTDALELTIKTVDLNNKLLPLETNATAPDPLNLEFRVIATVNSNVDPVSSAGVGQVYTPYYVEIIYPVLFVPGSYQGWNPSDSTTSIGSVGQNTNYEGYIWFDTDNVEFKYTQGPSWDVNWGDDGADGTLNPGGSNILAGAAGYYWLKVDLAALTHSFLRTEWAVIGDATPGGWDTDTDMTYDPVAKVWTVTMNLTAAKIKFRANNAWDLNYGDDGPNGVLEQGGADIQVPSEGNYTITLNLSKPLYTYTLVKN